ncbi:MAG TPA: AIPR family protein [Anaerolineales bacterium]|nr:AIPR family protein [Anaerolineales bacterium]
MITDRQIDQAFSDLRSVCGGVREDYFGLIYLEKEHGVPREKALNQIAFGGNDYGLDGFHFDEQRRNLYLFQFKYSSSHTLFKDTLLRLIDSGMQRIFVEPNRDDHKNQVLVQLRSCLLENRSVIDQICFRFVFTGDAGEAERSTVLDKLREDLENKKYLVDQFFGERKVGFVVEYRSSSGRVGSVSSPSARTSFAIPLTELVQTESAGGHKMHIGFIRLMDLNRIHKNLGPRFFDNNIRYGLGESEAVNRAISNALKQIILDQTEDPSVFSFNHNGVTLFAERVTKQDDGYQLTAPRLLNGAQTVTTLAGFLEKNKDNPKFNEGKKAYEEIRVLCKIITDGDQKFVTRVTINNNRQNPVEPWNLHANDLIQLELQDKLKDDVGVYYERQENAFNQLSVEELEDYGIKEESKAIQMLRLTQTFILTDGQISRISEMRRIFEDEKIYEQVFRQSRLRADSRHILLCYKVQFRLRKLADEIAQKGQNKYWFVSRARYLLWALLCQGLLNHNNLDDLAEEYGNSMSLPFGYTDILTQLATTRVRLILAELMQDKEYEDKVKNDNLSFLRTDKAFDKCMDIAYRKWGWVHKKLQ